MKKFKVFLYEPLIGKQEKKLVNDCLNTNWISSRGKYVKLFEDRFKRYINSKYAISVCNGTVALHLALVALGIKNNDEVLVPTFTYVSTVNAIKYVNAKVKFVDSNMLDWQMDEKSFHKKITKKTKAVIVPHIYGNVCNIKKIKQICKKNKIFLIEDCAEAVGTFYKNQHVGTFGDVSTFSFFGSKTITTGEGGMVTTNNKFLAEKIERLKMVGVSKKKFYWHYILGYNYRMTNICAAIGYAQLSRIKSIIKKKREIFLEYKKNLANLPIKLLDGNKEKKNSYWLVSFVLKKKNIRDKLRNYLENNLIETRPCFYPIHTMPIYKKDNGNNKFPVADYLGSNGITLPSSPKLSKKQIKYVCKKIKDFLINEDLVLNLNNKRL